MAGQIMVAINSNTTLVSINHIYGIFTAYIINNSNTTLVSINQKSRYDTYIAGAIQIQLLFLLICYIRWFLASKSVIQIQLLFLLIDAVGVYFGTLSKFKYNSCFY